jgi:hypothetical protein
MPPIGMRSALMPLNGIEDNGAPLSNQIEVCLFGKGYGECVTIHLGNNIWAIVDSFLHPKTKRPIAIEYLESLAIDIAERVRLVIISHWHDDHIRGSCDIVLKANSARVVLSQAMHEKEFAKFVKRHKTAANSKVDEMNKILELFLSKPAHRLFPRLASHGKSLLELSSDEMDELGPCKIQALSPSDADVWDFMQQIARMMPAAKKAKRPARKIKQNEASIVTWVNYDEVCLLLGADMETRKGNDRGWNAIVKSDLKPGKAMLYKVAHHGSKNGYNQGKWTELLTETPIAIVTPFINGKVKLPTLEQIKVMWEHTGNLFATGLPLETKTKKRSAAVEKEIRNVKLRALGSGLGAIRLRSTPMSEGQTECFWSVELFGQALHLQQ